MDKHIKIRVANPYNDRALKRDVRTGEVLIVTPKRMLEIMAVEEEKNVELFTIISIEKGEL